MFLKKPFNFLYIIIMVSCRDCHVGPTGGYKDDEPIIGSVRYLFLQAQLNAQV